MERVSEAELVQRIRGNLEAQGHPDQTFRIHRVTTSERAAEFGANWLLVPELLSRDDSYDEATEPLMAAWMALHDNYQLVEQ